MWYEILAPALIMAGLFKLPDLIAPVLCKAINGKVCSPSLNKSPIRVPDSDLLIHRKSSLNLV